MSRLFKNLAKLTFACFTRPELVLRKANLLELEVEGDLVEYRPKPIFLQRFMAKPPTSFPELIFALKEAETDPNIKACLVRLKENSLGWGRAAELREAIQRLRGFGKKTVAFLEETGNIEYYVGASCDEVIITPAQGLNLIGLVGEVLYFKGIMDKLEVKPELVHAGKYKSAVEPYTRESMSPEHREALNAIMDDIFGELVESIARNRNLAAEKVRELIDNSPCLPEEALASGLVDKLAYADQLDERIEQLIGEPVRRINHDFYLRLRKMRLGSWRPFKRIPRLALIYASGVIEQTDEREYQNLEESITPSRLTQALAAVRENPHLKAAILRVDSPGGSAVASDLIWREINLLGKAKPLIVSMGDVAASGGYYLSMPAERILAQDCTLTGSIGVIAGKLNLRGLYNKFGLNKEQLKRGQNADLYSDYTDLSGTRGEKINKEVQSFYDKFVQKAADARKMSWQELDQRAQGRVWTGKAALRLGLIDEIGGLRQAIDAAKRACGLRPEEKASLEIHPRPKRKIFPLFPFRLPYLPFLGKSETKTIAQMTGLARDKILMLMPFLIKIR